MRVSATRAVSRSSRAVASLAACITVRPWCDLDQVIGEGFEREDARPCESVRMSPECATVS
jgi:hypothetical protein